MSGQTWLNQISSDAKHAAQLYHRLILVVESTSEGWTGTGLTLAEHLQSRRVNVSMELGQRLLDLPARQRPLRVGRLLAEIVAGTAKEVVLLDNLEILFDESLKQEPLRFLQSLSRDRTIVAVWSGALEDGSLTYAVPGHPEHRRYSTADLLVTARDAVETDK